MHPNNNEMHKRTEGACDSCYKRKIKCDAAVPQCNWCCHHNLPCTFDRVFQRKRKKEDGGIRPRVSRLSERINRIEQLLTENLMRDPSSVPPKFSEILDGNKTASSSRSTSSSNQPLISSSVGVHFAGRELGVINLLTGFPFLLPGGQEWIQARTGQTISSDKLCPAREPWEEEREQTSYTFLMNNPSQNLHELPDWRVVRVYFEAYKSSAVMQRTFPVVDVELFEETIHAAYQQPQSNFRLGQASSRACIFAFLAFAARFLPLKKEFSDASFPPVDHDALASRSQFLLAQTLQDPANLDGAQAMTMLTLCGILSGNIRATNYFGAIAARQLFMLGANLTSNHISHQGEYGQRRQHQLRNLFWICYTIDKDVALRTGQPPIIADENCELTLPPGYLDRAFSDPEKDDNPSMEPVFPFDLRLSIIKSRAYSHLYSVSALQKSDADLLKSIRELDDELEKWRLSIPPDWRPIMSFSPKASDPNVSMHSLVQRLNYYLCMTVIHQAGSRCKAWIKGSGTMDGVSSSLALSVEASRSTLCYLEAAEHVLIEGVFRALFFYPMSALLTTFCSILQTPLDPRSRDDLDRLGMITAIMERIFSQKLPEDEAVHFKLVADFVAKLKRLAECAIDKAWREQSSDSVLPQ